MTRHYHPAHRRQAAQWARDLLQRRFLVLDTETTGLGAADEIIQIGIVDQDGAPLMNQLLKPSIPIPAAAARIHGISDEDVAGAPAFTAIYITLSALLAGATLVAYNMEFDWRLLQQTAARYRLPPARTGKRHCAMRQYARYKSARKAGGRGYKPHKLAIAAAQEGLTIERAHDALDDARTTLALLRKMAASA